MVEVFYAHNAQSLSPTGSDNNIKRRSIAPCSSSSTSSMILEQQGLQQQQQQQQSQGEPQQDASLSSNAPPPFLTKTYDMIDDPASDPIVSWTSKGASFVVWNPLEFSRDLLPRYFKHNNFSSFVRQLNTYGFRKVDPDRCEFANEGFRRGQRQMLKNIHRKKPTAQGQSHNPHGQSSEIGKSGLEGEVEKLNRDKNVLMLELVRLRQQQQQTERELQAMGQRLHGTEQRQQHMISFMAKAIQSPGFLASIVQEGGGGPFLTGNKRRKLELCSSPEMIIQEDDSGSGIDGQIVRYDPQHESTRARLIEFFSRPDLASKLEVVPLEVLVRELIPYQEQAAAAAEDVEDAERRSVRATLTEMQLQHAQQQALPISLEERLSVGAPVVTDVSGQSPIDIPPTPPLDLCLEAKDLEENRPAVTSDGDATSSLATTTSASSEDASLSNRTMTSIFKLVGEVNASVDSGAVGVGMNNGFWEQFLGASDPGNAGNHAGISRRSSQALPWWVTHGKPAAQEKQPDQTQDLES